MVRILPLWKMDIMKLSLRSSRCWPRAKTFQPSRLAAWYIRPLFILKQNMIKKTYFYKLLAVIAVGLTLSRMRRWSWRRPPWLVSWWPVPRRDRGSPARPCSRAPGAWGRKPNWGGSKCGHQQNSNLLVFSQFMVSLNRDAMLSMFLCSCRSSKRVFKGSETDKSKDAGRYVLPKMLQSSNEIF